MFISVSSNLSRLVRRLGAAILVVLFGVVLAGTAAADSFETRLEDGQGNIIKQYTDIKKKITYLFTPATSGGCGSLIKTDLRDVPPTSVTYQFTGIGSDGCGPDLLIFQNESIIVVATQGGGKFNAGAIETFDAKTLQPIASQPMGGPASVPPNRQSDSKVPGPAPLTATSTNIFVTGNTAVYEVSVDANGNLSSPIPIHTFSTSGNGGFAPHGQAVLGADGNLYGTTEQGGGKCSCGTVYSLTPMTVGTTTTWTYTVLYTFKSRADGGRPIGDIAIDATGNLFGTTSLGGMSDGAFTPCGANGFPGPVNAGCGVVFELLNNGATAPWPEKVLWTFSGGADGATPEAGVVLDAKGHIYGTTFAGGNTSLAACSGSAIENADPGCGVVFELSGPKFHRTESVLYSFMGSTDGAEPMGPVQLAGKDIYGSTAAGGDTTDVGCSSAFGVAYANGCGVVFELTP